ncbi:MAG TPA: radical SAM protein [Thermoplasmata archaeon]|nr:radical SAM protein [Thermoplasmata archaeon]
MTVGPSFVQLSRLEGRVDSTFARDLSRPVMLIGFQQQGNLGLGYLSAVVRQEGYKVIVGDFEDEAETLLGRAQQEQPSVIGFSLIFQFHVHRFAYLARYFRSHGVSSHFTIGGHFPSLSWERTLDLIPDLDSVVRFEGEQTLLELVDRVATHREWHDLRGIAYRGDIGGVCNELRPLITNLDDLPFPDREYDGDMILGRRIMPILASRGCSRTCSFCSIHAFYRSVRGKVVRTRRPAEVVREMLHLRERKDASIFLFQDDDFPLFGPAWRRWTDELLGELHGSKLPERTIWKINCRADSVESTLFARLKEAGLYMVYMGLESGTEEGLETLNKGTTVEENLRAVSILKSLGIRFDFGFMLLDPSSTFDSVRSNVRFLRQIVGDGTNPAIFCRMLPYDGTPIKKTLESTGRFRGDVCNPDYDFLDPRLNAFYEELAPLVNFAGWIHGNGALSTLLKSVWEERAVSERLFPDLDGAESYEKSLREVTRESNEMLLGLVEGLADIHEAGADAEGLTQRPADVTEDFLRLRRNQLTERVYTIRNAFVARNQGQILRSLGLDSASAVGS